MTELLERLSADVGGRYVIERELGRGGMATVYLARDLLDEQQVAIKVMDPELAAAVGADRFKREIEVASRLQHPNILGILGAGEAAGTSYYVMPFVRGETLRDRLDREKQLPIEDAIRIAREVADALDFAHQQGVVHRDIKPENILLEDGKALVADFGIARAASSADNKTLTKTGVALGTPHYMSPEQIFAEKDIDGRTDQYALACMLHEMLAGQPPFVGPHAQSLMAQHALDEPPLVTRFRPTTPTNVEDAILTGLAKTRADRFPTLHDFHDALANTGYTSLMKATRTRAVPTAAQLEAMKPPPVPLWKKVVPIAAAMVLAVGATYGIYEAMAGQSSGLSTPEEIERAKRVAVLYLTSDDSTLDPMATGFTEALIERLSGIPGLNVVSRSGVAPYRGSALASDSIGRALGVGTVITGRLREDGGNVRVDVKLIETADGTEADKGGVSVPASNVVSMRDSLASRVADLLRRYIGSELELAEQRLTTRSGPAWTALQRSEAAGRIADSLGVARAGPAALAAWDRADSLARASAAADDKWTVPLVQRARLATSRAVFLAEIQRDRDAAKAWLDSAGAFTNAALALNAKDADALEVRGSASVVRFTTGLAGDRTSARPVLDGAKRDLEAAVAVNPRQTGALEMLSRFAYSEYNVTEAYNYAQRAYSSDQWLRSAPSLIYRLFITAHDRNDFQNAEQWCKEGFARFPGEVRFTRCKLQLLTMRQATAAPGRVWGLVDSIVALTPPAQREYSRREAMIFGAAAMVRAELPDSARMMLMRARADDTIDPDDELLGYEAFVRTLLGEKDAAVQIIAEYVAKHPEHLGGFKRANFWWWQPLQDHPGFQRITKLGE